MRFADYDDERDDGYEPRYGYRAPRRQHPRRRDRGHDDGLGEVHARLDRLTYQLERIAGAQAARLDGGPRRLPRGRPAEPLPQPDYAPPAFTGTLAIDAAVAEINARQRALYGEAPVYAQAAPVAAFPEPAAPEPRPERAPAPPEPNVDISALGDQLRSMTAQLEKMRPTIDFERVIAAIREDLAEVRRQLTQARPRHDVESLELEVHALAQRIDRSRQAGVDQGELARLERGLAEIRDALRGLTPAENLAGFDEAVRALSQKIDQIVAREDPAILQQLETAIDALRGIVANVASNDTLNKLAEDVRALAARVDDIAASAAGGAAASMLQSRIDSLAAALNASADAGHAMPRELEKLLSSLVDKLERAPLTSTDHTALGNLEDRIAQLMKRLDASDARLGNLEAIERGLADLLVHLDQIRGGNVAEIRRSEQRTQDSLEAVHGTVEQMIDRLAMIESDIHDGEDLPHRDAGEQVAIPRPVAKPQLDAVEAPAPKPVPRAQVDVVAALAPNPAQPIAPTAPPAAVADPRRTGAPRQPIDPNLPPDHPLEPGFGGGSRSAATAAERIAASESVAEYAKPPVIPDPEDKPNFIAAARRAARAATATAPPREVPPEPEKTEKPKPRMRKFLVAGGAVLIAVGCVQIALHLFQNNAPVQPPAKEVVAPPVPLPESDASKSQAPQPGPLVLPVPGAASDGTPAGKPNAPQNAAPEPAHTENPAPAPAPPPAIHSGPTMPPAASREMSQHDRSDVTGSIPRAPLPPLGLPTPPDPATAETLPATIGGPALRAAALAGDAAAEFEVATRLIEGHGLPPNSEQAARWLERAARQGLAPAQFRLGGLYEKGIGVKKDLVAARDLYRAAADKGNGKAMHNLAVLYAEGINGPADYRSAAQWFRKAADHGITDSQFNLAVLYARGVGVEQSFAEAYKWFSLAASQGDNEAAKKRDEVASHLDSQALAAAATAVQKWSALPQPEDAISVKPPPGGWDLQPQAAKSKPRPLTAPRSISITAPRQQSI